MKRGVFDANGEEAMMAMIAEEVHAVSTRRRSRVGPPIPKPQQLSSVAVHGHYMYER